MKIGRRRWIIAAALFVSAFWPRLFDFDDLPSEAPEGYREEAVQTFWLMHDNPVERAWFGLMAQAFIVHDWRIDPGSCDAGSTTWPAFRDARTTLTVLGPWGIPIARDAITCGGAGWHREAGFVAELPGLDTAPRPDGASRNEPPPAPPLPPPPPPTP